MADEEKQEKKEVVKEEEEQEVRRELKELFQINFTAFFSKDILAPSAATMYMNTGYRPMNTSVCHNLRSLSLINISLYMMHVSITISQTSYSQPLFHITVFLLEIASNFLT
jgi:hypothetical protein